MPDQPADYAPAIGRLLQDESAALCRRWLDELEDYLSVDELDIFPTDTLLDHIPSLIDAVAADLAENSPRPIMANSAVVEKAAELGRLRHEQGATVRQLLKEYELLATVLFDFVDEETRHHAWTPTFAETTAVMRHLYQAVETLQRSTVDMYVDRFTEEIQEQHDRLSSFNQTVSHELRNPMHTLRLAAEVLSATSDDGERADAVASVQESVGRIDRVLRSLERASNPEAAEEQDLEVREVALSTLVNGIVDELEELAREHDVEIRASDSLPRVAVDLGGLHSALANLLTNAILYSDADKDERFVTLEAEELPDAELVIRVRDNGIGIPPDQIEQAQQRFHRVNREHLHDRQIDGHGLGLTISKQCVERMGGSLEIESEPGRGTTVIVTIPDAVRESE